jgi:hypothetical protein
MTLDFTILAAAVYWPKREYEGSDNTDANIWDEVWATRNPGQLHNPAMTLIFWYVGGPKPT